MQPNQYPHTQSASERPLTLAAAPAVQKFTPYSSNSFNATLQHPSTMPTVSWQALRTFAPEHRVVTPDAPHVPIRSLHLGKALVRVSGRTVRAPDVKAFPDRFDSSKRRWLLTFTIKDDIDTIDVKFWHKSQEHLNSYSNITLDQVVHILTDEVKLNNNPATGNQTTSTPSTSSPLCLHLSEGKFGHTIDVGSDDQQNSMFKHALGANAVGSIPCMPIKQIVGAIGSLKNQRFNMVVCVKKVANYSTVTTKNGPLTKTELCVFDAHGAEMSMILWGDQLSKAVQQWTPYTTVLVLTGAQASVYGLKMQITLGYQTHIQVDPVCKDVEWLRHFSVQCQELPEDQNPVAEAGEITPKQIRSLYGVLDIKNKAESLGTLETAYGYTYAVVSELGIDNRSDVLTAKCPSCKNAVSSFKMEVCSACNTMPPGEGCWRYDISRSISFMDDTGELHHPIVSSAVFQTLLGFKPNEFSALSMVERSQLKKRYFLERVKIFFKLAWSDFKKVPVVEIVSIESVDLYDFESQNEVTV